MRSAPPRESRLAVPPDPFAPARLGPVTARNRLIKAATFEGLATRGEVTDELVAFHRATAAGGVGITTLAYCAVEPRGRTYRDQLVLDEPTARGLTRLTDAVHEEGALAAAQIGHAGTFANARANRLPAIGPSRAFSPLGATLARAASTGELDRLRDTFARGAELAVRAGFDVLELHLGHGYLLSQFLSPASNRRRDGYGGDATGRARFPREVVAAVRAAVGREVAVTAKVNLFDGFRGGATVDDATTTATLLAEDGHLDALQLSAGSTSRAPMALLRGDSPLRGMIETQRDPLLRLGMRLIGGRIVRPLPFEEGYLRDAALHVSRAATIPTILLGGITRRASVEQAMADGFAFVAMARALLHDPTLPRRWAAGEDVVSGCTHCNGCIVEMERDGTVCVLTGGPVA